MDAPTRRRGRPADPGRRVAVYLAREVRKHHLEEGYGESTAERVADDLFLADRGAVNRILRSPTTMASVRQRGPRITLIGKGWNADTGRPHQLAFLVDRGALRREGRNLVFTLAGWAWASGQYRAEVARIELTVDLDNMTPSLSMLVDAVRDLPRP